MGLLHFNNCMNNALFLISTYILNILVVGSDCFWNWVVFVKYTTQYSKKKKKPVGIHSNPWFIQIFI